MWKSVMSTFKLVSPGLKRWQMHLRQARVSQHLSSLLLLHNGGGFCPSIQQITSSAHVLRVRTPMDQIKQQIRIRAMAEAPGCWINLLVQSYGECCRSFQLRHFKGVTPYMLSPHQVHWWMRLFSDVKQHHTCHQILLQDEGAFSLST